MACLSCLLFSIELDTLRLIWLLLYKILKFKETQVIAQGLPKACQLKSELIEEIIFACVQSHSH